MHYAHLNFCKALLIIFIFLQQNILWGQESQSVELDLHHQTPQIILPTDYIGCGIAYSIGDVTLDNTGLIASLMYTRVFLEQTALDISLKVLGYSSSPRLPDNNRYALSSNSWTGDIIFRYALTTKLFLGAGVSFRYWNYMAASNKIQFPFETDIAFFQHYSFGGNLIVEHILFISEQVTVNVYGQINYLPITLELNSTIPPNIPFPISPRIFSLGTFLRINF